MFVPGSSLRGAMRSLLERLLQTIQPRSSCVLFDEVSHPDCFTAKANAKERLFRESLRGRDPGEQERQITAKLLGDGLCDTCKLFGAPLLASRLRISDASLTGKTKVFIRDGVGIDRDTETDDH